MYESHPSFVLGFHGCDKAAAEKVFAGRDALKGSTNSYDWLGHGIYFWEQNPERALRYAEHLRDNPRKGRPRIKTPAVVGAIIDLGFCLNLLDAQFLAIVKQGYKHLAALSKKAEQPLPRNKHVDGGRDRLIRHLDCGVIETVHQLREDEERQAFDTARGVFVEGEPLYPDAGFHEHNHIQLCVRNPRCVKGYFRVMDDPDA